MEPSLIFSILTISSIAMVSLWIVLEKRRPTSTLAWILALVALPYVGLALYLVFGRRRLRRRTTQHARKVHIAQDRMPSLADTAHDEDDHSGALARTFAAQAQLIQLAVRNADAPITVLNDVDILCDASEAYPAIFEALAGAKRYIHVEYYIIQPDTVGARLRDLLVKKAREGVDVRLLCDGVGSWRLGRDWFVPLEEAGAQCAFFLPLRIPLVPTRFRWNFRNHRKVVVVDGESGFTGGLNIGEEYEGKDARLGRWRDLHLRIRGPAVGSLERIFAEDWYFATSRLLPLDDFFHKPSRAGNEAVQVIPSGPDREWQSIHLQVFMGICTARQRVWMTTPYFVPDDAIRVAMIAAALRGVDVRLLVPSRSDLRSVLWAGRSYFGELLRAGVRIYEYQGGFLHAKAQLVDDDYGTIGSANMDIRSFRLNFEVNAWVYSSEFALKLQAIFEHDIENAKEISLEAYHDRSWHARFLEASARLLSPLL